MKYSPRSREQSGFTTIELILLVVVIGILVTLIVTTRAGVQQKQRNAERERDVKELRDGLEGYFAGNNRYPSLAELNNAGWRSTHLKALEGDAFRDPLASDGGLTAKPQTNVYAYSVTSASGTECGSDQGKPPCTQYTLTATMEGGGIYTKTSLN